MTEAEQLARPEGFDYLHRIGDGYTQLRRYTPPSWRSCAEGRAGGARILKAVETLKALNARQTRKVPEDAPTGSSASAGRAWFQRRRPSLLRTVRPVRAEERPALRRHLGAGLAPVQGLRGISAAAAEFAALATSRRAAAAVDNRLRTRIWKRGCRCWNSSWPRSIAWPRPTSCRTRLTEAG